MGGLSACRKCGKMKNATNFHKNGKQGRLRTCIDCRRETANAKHRRFYLANIEKRRQKNKEHYQNNKEYYKQHNEAWKKQNLERMRTLWARKYQDPAQRVSSNISRNIRRSIHLNKNGKSWRMLVGYTLAKIKNHLESLFSEGMTWENYGKWHIDHIIPISFFQFNSFDDVEFRMCWRLENLQPLWATDNIRKGNKIARKAG